MITSKEYWDEVTAMAEILVEEEEDRDDVDACEALHDMCGAHPWIIYTAHHLPIAMHSPNDEAWEDMGFMYDPTSAKIDQARAYCALYQDVAERADRLKEEAQ